MEVVQEKMMVEEISPYLAYNLITKVADGSIKGIDSNLKSYKVIGVFREGISIQGVEKHFIKLDDCKPILNHLEDFTDIDSANIYNLHLGLHDKMLITHFALGRTTLERVRKGIVDVMNKAHIDYNGLIDRGLAVDYKIINNQNKES